jgi:hypothetical protein
LVAKPIRISRGNTRDGEQSLAIRKRFVIRWGNEVILQVNIPIIHFREADHSSEELRGEHPIQSSFAYSMGLFPARLDASQAGLFTGVIRETQEARVKTFVALIGTFVQPDILLAKPIRISRGNTRDGEQSLAIRKRFVIRWGNEVILQVNIPKIHFREAEHLSEELRGNTQSIRHSIVRWVYSLPTRRQSNGAVPCPQQAGMG